MTSPLSLQTRLAQPPAQDSEAKVAPRPRALPVDALNFVDCDSHGPDVLLLVPTANAFKVKTLTAVAERLVRAQKPGAGLRVVKHPAASGVPEQPFDAEGVTGACNRANDAMAWLRTDAGRAELRLGWAGTVLVGSIENYIDRAAPAADHGAVLLCNVGRRHAALQISDGVTVPVGYGAAIEEQSPTELTVGKLLARDVPGIAHDDWHAFVTPHSRYTLLEAAAEAIDLRL